MGNVALRSRARRREEFSSHKLAAVDVIGDALALRKNCDILIVRPSVNTDYYSPKDDDISQVNKRENEIFVLNAC
jgi:hypothetical protein